MLDVVLVSFGPRGAEQPALLADELLYPLRPALEAHGLEALGGPGIVAVLPALGERLLEAAHPYAVPAAGQRLGPPLTRPGKILGVAANYHAFVAQARARVPPVSPTQQMVFAKLPSAITGPADPLVAPREATSLDYELELAVVIGAPGRRIPRERALEHVAGYMMANDVTAPSLIRPEPDVPGGPLNPLNAQVTRGKGADTFLPTGPWMAPAAAVDLDAGLELTLHVNGDLRQHASTLDLVLDVPALVEWVSAFATLHPGDVLLTGSPPGTGMLHEPPIWLQPGDIVTAEITGLGRMETPVVAETA
jgi:2,4-diketo-3-deoxy-L-fuconate hydrolase